MASHPFVMKSLRGLRAGVLIAGTLAVLDGSVVARVQIQDTSAGAHDDDDDAKDHVRAFEALRRGRIVPVSRILDWLEANYSGNVVEVELESDSTPLSYEVEYLTDTGDFLEFHFDATTGQLLRVKGEGADRARRPR